MKLIKTLAIAALFFLTASTSAALADDTTPVGPQGAVIELEVAPIHDTAEQNIANEDSTTSTSNDANIDVIEGLRTLNEMARQSARTGEGW